MLRFLSRRGRSLSSLVEPLRSRYSQAPERNLRVARKTTALRAVEDHFPGGRISRLDGLSVAFEDFWFNLRPSNTEPLLRLRVEAVDAETAERRSREIADIIRSEVGYED
jgi:phosphomannomutase